MNNKKVYIISSASRSIFYGIGTYIYNLTSSLKENNIDFEVILLHAECYEIQITTDKGYRQVSIPTVPYRKKEDVKHYYRNFAYLLNEYTEEEKDKEYIFHLNLMGNPQLISSLKKRFKCKIILTCHYTNWSFSTLGNEKKLISILNKTNQKRTNEEKTIYHKLMDDINMIKKSDCFICVAEHSLRTFLKVSNIDSTKCIVINNAIRDDYKPTPKEELNKFKKKYYISENTKIILFVGRLDEVKGISALLKAFKKLLKKRTDVHLILAGEGTFSQWLKEAANCWTKITFTGRLDKKNVAELYKIADIGVITSLHEEFGLVALEMMMNKLPIVVSNVGGLAEIIENGISGIKVQVKNYKDSRVLSYTSLMKNMDILLNNKVLASEIAINGRNRFLEKYEIKIFKEKMLSLYNEL